jgi:hypothetical protein
MTRPAFLLLVCLMPFSAVTAAEETSESSAAVKAAQAFYDGYMKVLLASDGDSQAYVLKSKRVTGAFKKAYRAFMEEADSDPIICGQDYPDAGFKAGKPILKGEQSTVTMTSRDPSFPHSFQVFLKRGDEGWQISGTNDLKAGR